MNHGGPVEVGNWTPQPESCDGYHISLHPPWAMVFPGDRDRLPQIQDAQTADDNELGGSLLDLPEPTEYTRRPGQVPVP